ncbi:MAG: carboxypeptidase regulatory-like domain-containing protein [Terriglobales bacterium]
MDRIRRWGWTLAVILLGCAWLLPTAALAQSSTSGSVSGQITDQQGRVIVDAVLMLTNVSTNSVTPTVTNSVGRYSFSNLQPGTYNVTIKKAGFKTASLKNQLVTVGKNVFINVTLQVGEATQTVEVTASGAELQTLNSTISSSISGAAITELPNTNRDANSLTVLQPAVSMNGGVAGAAEDQNSYTIDGGNNTNDMDGGNNGYTNTTGGYASGVMPTPAASVSTFTVTTQNQTADVNSAAGSTVAMVTTRGTSTVHGSVYDYYLGSYLSANSWGNNQSGIARPKSHRNRFGASLGGQILPDWLGGKTYLFGNFEGLRYPQAPTYTKDTPTLTLRQGVVAATSGNEASEPVCSAGGAADLAGGCTDPNHTVTFYNLNPTSVKVGGITYAPALCNPPGGGTPVACDPTGLGLNPVVAQLWKQYMPLPNNPNAGDHFNTQGFTGNINTPETTNFFVTRIDHDFGAKTHFTLTYHFYSLSSLDSNAQHDIGGGIPGDTFGVPSTPSERPQLPSLWTAQFTTNINPNVTNTFNYSYLRNFWQWGGSYLNPTPLTNFPALGGALEIGGESSNALIPYNVNTQDVRTRVWDGVGNTFKDDITILHGNHLFQLGGRYTDQWDYHQRNDNGGGIMANTVYQIARGEGINFDYIPADYNTSPTSGADKDTYETAYAEALGIVSQPQTLYTRAGQDLALQPLGTPMNDNSYIPMYNVYFADAWHIKPSLTLSYGAGYTLEMPPKESQGKQVALVDAAGNPINVTDYLSSQERSALSGQAYDPEVGWATVGNVGAGEEYPYHPFYGGFSPRVSLAWNPNISGGPLGWLFGGNEAVLRGGWSRIYSRLNGVDLVLVPLLGTGLGQPVSCIGAAADGSCLGAGGVNPADAFRIGPAAAAKLGENGNGMTAPLGNPPSPTLPQPYFSGELQNGAPTASAGAGDILDPNFRPARSDEFDITFQRQITPQLTTMIGYTGRIIRNEYAEMDLDAVPYMTTAGGEQFQTAFANLYNQIAADPTGLSKVTPSPFFTAALGGDNSNFCKSAGDCALAVAEMAAPSGNDFIDPVGGNDVYSLWQTLQNNSSWTLGRTNMSAQTTCSAAQVGCPAKGVVSPGGQLSAVFDNASIGYGNYNALLWTVNFRNWHGLTGGSNFTWSRAMGTGSIGQLNSEITVNNPYDLQYEYGPQPVSTPIAYNAYFVWSPGAKSQNTFMQHLTRGWSFAPIITWQRIGNNFFGGTGATGVTQVVDHLGDVVACGAYGAGDCSATYTEDTAILTTGYTGGSGIVRNFKPGTSTVGSVSLGANGGTGMDRFSDPAAVLAEFRPEVLGEDTTGSEGNNIPGMSQTDVNFSVTKDLALSERFSTELNATATNLFNHFSASEDFEDLDLPSEFGVIGGNSLDSFEGFNREVELGLVVRW